MSAVLTRPIDDLTLWGRTPDEMPTPPRREECRARDENGECPSGCKCAWACRDMMNESQ